MDDIERQIIDIEHRIERLEDQVGHTNSLYESEQRVTVNQGKRIDYNERTMEAHQKILDRFEIILLNTGRGLTYEVDRLKERANSQRVNIALWLAVISAICSILALIFK